MLLFIQIDLQQHKHLGAPRKYTLNLPMSNVILAVKLHISQ